MFPCFRFAAMVLFLSMYCLTPSVHRFQVRCDPLQRRQLNRPLINAGKSSKLRIQRLTSISLGSCASSTDPGSEGPRLVRVFPCFRFTAIVLFLCMFNTFCAPPVMTTIPPIRYNCASDWSQRCYLIAIAMNISGTV